MRPSDLGLLLVPGVPAVHPDGRTAVVAVTAPDLRDDAYVGQLWVVPTDGSSAPHRLTRGAPGSRDSAPAYSPDGSLLAFLRTEAGGKPQLHAMPSAGGEPLRLTDAPLGVGAPRWSPDSTRLAYVARVPEPGRYGSVADGGPEAEPPRRITRLTYRVDDVGFTLDRPEQVFVVAVPDLDLPPSSDPLTLPVQLTDGDTGARGVAWSPDGTRLAFLAARHEARHTDRLVDAWTCTPSGGDVRSATDTSLVVESVAFHPDGDRLELLATDAGPRGLDFAGRLLGLYEVALDLAEGGAPRRRTDPAELELDAGALTPTPDGVLVQRLTRGAVELVRVEPGEALTALIGGEAVVLGHAATADGSTTVATVAGPGTPGELRVVGRESALTDLAGALRAAGVLAPRELSAAAEDGAPVHGWVVLPTGDGPHPVLLCIHGGPQAQWGWGLFDEAQVYAAAGYAVLLCNPRGSAGYGEEHARAIVGAMGDRDREDVLAFLDAALQDPDLHLDRGRVGVQGGSYGGYLTAWLTTSTDRFSAAIVERGFLDPVSFVGSADIGWWFPGGYLGPADGTDRGGWAAQSPMARVEQVRTPTLVIHSEQDWRCPVEQGQRWFTELRLRGVEAELLLFPGEGHELSRSGRPGHRVARLEHVLRWWARHLPV